MLVKKEMQMSWTEHEAEHERGAHLFKLILNEEA